MKNAKNLGQGPRRVPQWSGESPHFGGIGARSLRRRLRSPCARCPTHLTFYVVWSPNRLFERNGQGAVAPNCVMFAATSSDAV